MFQRLLDDLNRKKAGVHMIAEREGKHMESEAQRNAKWTDRTGVTRAMIHGGAEKNQNGATVYLAHGSKIGVYHEKGTGVYGPRGRPIRPVKAKVLAFKIDGKMVFAKEVKGMKPRPIVKPTAEKNIPHMKKVVIKWLTS